VKSTYILTAFLFVLNSNAQIDLTSNLVLCMPMNGNANDYSGNNNNGLVSGATPTVNRFGTVNSAYHFDGISSFISVPSSTSISNIENNDELTITAWCKPINWYQNGNIFGILEKYNPISDYGWQFTLANPAATGFNDVGFIVNYPIVYETNASVVLGQWDFYAVTYSKSTQTVSIYKNGNLVQSQSNSGTQFENTGSGNIYIGYSPVGTDEYSDGDIDELRLYNRALTAQEINALYLQEYSCSGELVPVASFVASQTVICAGQSIVFRDVSINNPTSWNWQIPGGSPASSSINNPTVTFNSPGVYTISLIASNGAGSSSVSVQTITVNNCIPAPVASFSISQKQICRGQSMVFTDQSTNSPTSWNWQIPGGLPASSSINNPTVSFSMPGVYTVSLMSSNSSGSSNTSIQTFTVSDCVSVSELNNSTSRISIYPNPSFGELYIDILEKDNSILVYNVLGQKVNVDQNRINEKTIQLRFDQYSYAIYLIKVLDDKGSIIQTSKVLINK
jgi:PKD repeat protein